MHETDTAIFCWLKISSDVSEEELALRKMIRFWTVELVASSLSCSNNRVCCSGACDFIILPKSSLSPSSGALPLFFVKSVLVAFSFLLWCSCCFPFFHHVFFVMSETYVLSNHLFRWNICYWSSSYFSFCKGAAGWTRCFICALLFFFVSPRVKLFCRVLQMCFLWMTCFPFLSEICVRTDPANHFLYNFLIQRYTKTFAWGVYIFIERSHVYSAADILMEAIRDYFLGNVVVVVFLDCCVSFANYYMLV